MDKETQKLLNRTMGWIKRCLKQRYGQDIPQVLRGREDSTKDLLEIIIVYPNEEMSRESIFEMADKLIPCKLHNVIITEMVEIPR